MYDLYFGFYIFEKALTKEELDEIDGWDKPNAEECVTVNLKFYFILILNSNFDFFKTFLLSCIIA